MTAIAEYTPPWVGAILGWRATWFLARLALSSAYLIGGVNKAIDFPGAVAEQAHFGLEPAWAWAIPGFMYSLLFLIGPVVNRFNRRYAQA